MTALVDLSAALAGVRAGVVAIERPDLAMLELNGADVLRYLHSVTTQHTADLRPGNATRALLLSPKGKIEFAFRLAVLDRRALLLDTEAEAAEALAERLARFVFRYDVRVGAPRPGAVSLLGTGADEALAAAGLPVPPAGPGEAAVAVGGLVAHRGELGVDLVGERAPGALRAVEGNGVARAPLEVWELLRVERGLPPRAGAAPPRRPALRGPRVRAPAGQDRPGHRGGAPRGPGPQRHPPPRPGDDRARLRAPHGRARRAGARGPAGLRSR